MEASKTVEQTAPPVPPKEEEPQQVNVLDVEVTNENIALNILVTFVNLAQKRGAFNLKESAKIWECIQRFQKASGSPPATSSSEGCMKDCDTDCNKECPCDPLDCSKKEE
tara:strand:+ start:11894 stop:12223 length:330 start_codon:yes stop_codon:yes gene_type:complete